MYMCVCVCVRARALGVECVYVPVGILAGAIQPAVPGVAVSKRPTDLVEVCRHLPGDVFEIRPYRANSSPPLRYALASSFITQFMNWYNELISGICSLARVCVCVCVCVCVRVFVCVSVRFEIRPYCAFLAVAQV